MWKAKKQKQHITLRSLYSRNSSWHSTRAAEKLRRAVEPGRESKPLSTASHLHNNSWRLSPWLHCDVTICMDASRGDASSRYSQQLDFTLHMPFVKEHKCISLKHPWSQWGKLLTVAELLPPTQTNMIVSLLPYRCRCCMQEWNNQYISTNIVLFDLNGGLMSFFNRSVKDYLNKMYCPLKKLFFH